MRDPGRLACGVGDDDRHPGRRDVEELLREFAGQVDAAVRFRIARQSTRVQRDTAPSEPLHVGHRRTVVDGRAMLLLLLQDREYAGRRHMSGTAGAHRGRADQDAVAIHVRLLLRDAHDHEDRARGHGIGHPQELTLLEVADGRAGGNRFLGAPEWDRVGERGGRERKEPRGSQRAADRWMDEKEDTNGRVMVGGLPFESGPVTGSLAAPELCAT